MTQIDLGAGPVEYLVDGVVVMRLHRDYVELCPPGPAAGQPGAGESRVSFITAKGDRIDYLNGIAFIQNTIAPYKSRGGTQGDVVLPNHHSSLRAASPDGSTTVPLVKLTRNGTPEFGRFPLTVANNDAVNIGAPNGILVVSNTTDGQSALFMVGGPSGEITKVADPAGAFSTRDADPGKLVVAWMPAPYGFFQIQNRTGYQKGIGWANLGGL